MTEKTVIIKSALDARQVAFFVQTAGKFQSDIKIAIDNKKVSAKSIMGMMSLGLDAGESVTVSVDGADEEEAMKSIEEYLSKKEEV